MELKKLPEGEFELMRVVWDSPSPITTNQIIAQLSDAERRKPQTVLTLLMRLVDRGFLRTERAGRERAFYPLVARDAYLSFESRYFAERFHLKSLWGLVSALYDGTPPSPGEREEILRWLEDRGEG